MFIKQVKNIHRQPDLPSSSQPEGPIQSQINYCFMGQIPRLFRIDGHNIIITGIDDQTVRVTPLSHHRISFQRPQRPTGIVPYSPAKISLNPWNPVRTWQLELEFLSMRQWTFHIVNCLVQPGQEGCVHDHWSIKIKILPDGSHGETIWPGENSWSHQLPAVGITLIDHKLQTLIKTLGLLAIDGRHVLNHIISIGTYPANITAINLTIPIVVLPHNAVEWDHLPIPGGIFLSFIFKWLLSLAV